MPVAPRTAKLIEPPTDNEGYRVRGDGDAYVYVLAKAPVSPSTASSRARSPSPGHANDGGTETSVLYGPGVYQVDPWVTERHNLRSSPKFSSLVVGALLGGDVIDVAKVVAVLVPGGPREHWAQLVRKSPGPPAWVLLANSGGVKFLRYVKRAGPDGTRGDWLGATESTDTYTFSSLDRAIAEQLGHVEQNDDDIDSFISHVADHELQLAQQAAAVKQIDLDHMKVSEVFATKKAERLANQQKDEEEKAYKARRFKMLEIWQTERPILSTLRSEQKAWLEEQCDANDSRCAQRLAQLRRERGMEVAVDLALQPSSWKTGHPLQPDEEDELAEIPSAADNAVASADAAKLAQSEAALTLAGVRDAPLAKSLVAMEAASAFYYRSYLVPE